MMPPPVEERRFVSFDGTEIAYQAVGRGRPILLCNGLAGSWKAWSHQMQYFRDRYRLLSWDYRGLYESGRPNDPSAMTVSAHARDGLQLLNEEGIERVAIVGWSMGAQVALEMFRLAPDKVASLALVNGLAGRPWDYVFNLNVVGRLLPPFLRGLRSAPRVIETIIAQASRFPDAGAWIKRVGLAARTLDEGLFGVLVEDFRTLDMETYIGLLERLGEHDAWDLLPQIDVPTLLITGSRDAFTPRSAAERMARRIRGSELMVSPGATHYAALEDPEMLNLRLEKFLRERGYEAAPGGAG
ncbi:MAG: alpha/beta hydrolase [Deltaproteobacteria bacterium]|nr:alpha/beta hydrolase [Deltaproteobacteria bacterium]